MTAKARVPGTFKNAPPEMRRDLTPSGAAHEQMLRDLGALHAERWTLGDCSVMVAREPRVNGEWRWHLSIAHPTRYPTWDEIKTAAFSIDVLQGVTLAQVFTPGDSRPWLNVHDNCFHLFEIHDPGIGGGVAGE